VPISTFRAMFGTGYRNITYCCYERYIQLFHDNMDHLLHKIWRPAVRDDGRPLCMRTTDEDFVSEILYTVGTSHRRCDYGKLLI